MPHNRFFKSTSFQEGTEITLSEEEAKHAKVMRLQKEELCELVNGKNELAQVKILSVSPKFVVKVLSVKSQKNPPSFSLAIGNMKLSKLELIIQKGSELGVNRFYIFDADFSEKKELSPSQTKRLEDITISALKQCGRLDLPSIEHFVSLQKIPHLSSMSYLYGSLEEKAPFFQNSLVTFPTLFFIGPEKGFSDKEILYLKNTFKAQEVRLSNQILRAETAAIVACAVLSLIN